MFYTDEGEPIIPSDIEYDEIQEMLDREEFLEHKKAYN